MGRIVKVQGMALAKFACLAKANIILHLPLTKVNGNQETLNCGTIA
jgi:hypothetical protein